MKYRFHLLGFPHTATNREYNACAYTAKILKFIKMMAPRGHEIIHYGNEGSDVSCEHVQVLSEEERASWFGTHDRQKLYDLKWDINMPYWRLFNQRCVERLQQRVQKGDFILSLAGACHKPIADAFPGSASGVVTGPWFVEYGIGYYGTFSRYRVYESQTHREWCHGRLNSTYEDNDDTVIHNYFDLDDFHPDLVMKGQSTVSEYANYYVFVGRIIHSKGWRVAVEATRDLGARLVLVGQGDPGPLEHHVKRFGHATIEQRAALFGNAIASFAPTHYREPFGGVAVESQLCGTPCITTDHGAFVETVEPRFRCASHREFVEAAKLASELDPMERETLRQSAIKRWGLEAIAPQYERYFGRLHSRWGEGWYEMRPPELVRIPGV